MMYKQNKQLIFIYTSFLNLSKETYFICFFSLLKVISLLKSHKIQNQRKLQAPKGRCIVTWGETLWDTIDTIDTSIYITTAQ
jgi:hypothetical protein